MTDATFDMSVLLVAAEPEPWNWGNWLALAALLVAGIVGAVDWKRGQDAAKRERERDDWQKKVVEEQVEIQRQQAETQRKSYELSLEVHESQRQQAEPAPPTDEQPSEAEPEPPAFSIRFAYRDSAHQWARLIATYNGPTQARNVLLSVWGERDGQRLDAFAVQGMDFRHADKLPVGDSVHTAVAFGIGTPAAHELHYKVEWTDERRKKRTQEGPVPLD